VASRVLLRQWLPALSVWEGHPTAADLFQMSGTPQRIACLSAEAADWFFRLGVWDSVAGVTVYFESPHGAAPKPRISGFSSANLTPILDLNPDLVITFSDVQAGLAAQLVSRGCNVVATNQRTLDETVASLALLARVVGREAEGHRLLEEFRKRIEPVPEPMMRRPRIYFEEWNEPLVTGIAWVSELIERAGGEDVFAGLRIQRAAQNRVVTEKQVRGADPEIMFASWCGMPVDTAAIRARPGWEQLSAVRAGRIHEIPGADILQPGFRLVQGYETLKRHIEQVRETTLQPVA
jgi:iron complex transport system substrate-binding protein